MRAVRLLLAPLLLTLLLAGSARAQHDARHVAEHRDGDVIAADTTVDVYIPPAIPAGKLADAQTANIVVRYQGFPPEALEAFAYAVSIWEAHISSAVPIRVDAQYVPIEGNEGRTLGAAGATLVFANEPFFALQNTWYPAALAKAITGEDLTAGDPGEDDQADIFATFNSSFENWYFGIDGNPLPGQYDFVTVALHELGHGLGFFGRIQYDDGVDNDECPTAPEGWGCWGLGQQRFPLVFDRFTEDVAGISLLNTDVYPNPSRALGDVLQSGEVFFDGITIRSANAEVPVDLYAPAVFELGSSYSHLDESAFPAGTPDALMTPFVSRQEAIHTPGAITCAIFDEMGWPLGAGCVALLASDVPLQFVAFDVDREDDAATLSWEITRPELVERFEVLVAYYDEPIDTLAVDADEVRDGAFEAVIEGLDLGSYTLRLRVVSSLGAVVSEPVEFVVPVPQALVVQPPYPNPFAQTAVVDVFVGSRQQVEVSVYDAAGRRVAVLFDGVIPDDDRRRLVIDATGWSPGVYFVQAVGEDGFSTSEGLVHIRP